MSAHPITLDDLPRDGERLDLAKVSKVNGVLLMVGGFFSIVSLWFLSGLAGSQKQSEFAYSWLFAFFFYFTITNGAIFWTMLQHVSNSSWSVTVRRVFENIGTNVKWMALFFLPLLIPNVRDSLWEWYVAHKEADVLGHGNVREGLEEMVKHGNHHVAVLTEKYGFLNRGFWLFRACFYFAFLSFIITSLRRWSIQQDSDGDFKHTFRMRAWCAFPMLLYALSVTFSAVDWVMTLDYTWFSTMWGVYIFAGGAGASMALSILVLIYIRSNGYLQKVTSAEHFHLMGKLLLAFTIFWAYIAFSQFFLIWYANITEETRFYLLRNTGGWWYLSNVLVWGHFVVSFVLLLSAGRKKKPGNMIWLGAWVLLMHCADIYWMIIPERGPSLTSGSMAGKLGYTGEPQLWLDGAWFGDLVAFLAIGGIVGWTFLRRLAKASLYPCRDPRLLESVKVSN